MACVESGKLVRRVVSLVFCVALVAGHANAQDSTEEARRHYRQGIAEYNKRSLASAQREFRMAYSLAPNYRVLYNLGVVEMDLGHAAAACRAFDQYMIDGRGDISPDREAEVKAALVRLRPEVGYVTVSVSVADATLLLDAVPFVASSRPVALEPGQHTFAATRPGYRRAEVAIAVKPGDSTNTRLILEPEPSVPAITATPAAPPPTRESTSDSPSSDGTLLPAGLLYGLSGALCATGAVTGVMALSTNEELDRERLKVVSNDQVARVGARAEYERLNSRASTYATLSNVFLVGGLVSAGAAIALTIWRPGKRTGSDGSAVPQVSLRFAPLQMQLNARF
jgi:hypothetical protein